MLLLSHFGTSTSHALSLPFARLLLVGLAKGTGVSAELSAGGSRRWRDAEGVDCIEAEVDVVVGHLRSGQDKFRPGNMHFNDVTPKKKKPKQKTGPKTAEAESTFQIHPGFAS